MKGRITGKALDRSGDFMPRIGGVPGGQMTPFKTRVIAFCPPVEESECKKARFALGFVYTGTREPTAVVETDEQGNFILELEQGEYSLFVEYYPEVFYSRSVRRNKAGTGDIVGPVDVVSDETQKHDMIVNRGTD